MSIDPKAPHSEPRVPTSKILIVDDEKSIRITLSAFLKDEGYAVETVEDAESAQELLKRERFDVVVSDIILPRVSGVALLQQIRETAPDVQVIMMTGEPTLKTAVEAVRAGAHDYLIKPVDKSAILLSVANAVKIKNLEDDKRCLEDENRRHRETLEQQVKHRTHELEETLEKLKKAHKQLIQQERMNALGQMASGIAHDFSNMLMPIIGLSEMLLSDPKVLDDRKEATHMLGIIRSAGYDARHIVQRLRHIYKEEDDEYGPVVLAEVVESIVSITMPKWKEEMNAKGIVIEIATEFEDVPLIKGNAGELREAFVNLMLNAVDAMPEGGAITLRLKPKDERGVVFEVSDTGIGMDAETLRQCVETFFTTKGTQGTGLGLPMVHGIVQRHGGSMEIDSKPGVGTTVRMQFPVPIAIELTEDTAESQPAPISPQCILVIDDEARSRNVVARILRADGHTVEIAEGGQEAKEMVYRKEFDLVITDRAMPVVNGDEIAAEIMKCRPGTPVIMLTGFGDIMKDCGELPVGVTSIITKPVTPNYLRCVISQVMNEGRDEGGDTKEDENVYSSFR